MPSFRSAPGLALVLALSAVSGATRAQPAPATSDARDSATVYIGTGNFLVGRIGSECLAMVGRGESPQQFVAQWQERNARYVMASAKYMEKRLEEATAAGGPERRDALLRDLRVAVQGNAEPVIRSWLQNKADGCMRAVTLVDTGALDISPKLPVFKEIEALVQWAEQ